MSGVEKGEKRIIDLKNIETMGEKEKLIELVSKLLRDYSRSDKVKDILSPEEARKTIEEVDFKDLENGSFTQDVKQHAKELDKLKKRGFLIDINRLFPSFDFLDKSCNFSSPKRKLVEPLLGSELRDTSEEDLKYFFQAELNNYLSLFSGYAHYWFEGLDSRFLEIRYIDPIRSVRKMDIPLGEVVKIYKDLAIYKDLEKEARDSIIKKNDDLEKEMPHELNRNILKNFISVMRKLGFVGVNFLNQNNGRQINGLNQFGREFLYLVLIGSYKTEQEKANFLELINYTLVRDETISQEFLEIVRLSKNLDLGNMFLHFILEKRGISKIFQPADLQQNILRCVKFSDLFERDQDKILT
jgi:hypothetical protein